MTKRNNTYETPVGKIRKVAHPEAPKKQSHLEHYNAQNKQLRYRARVRVAMALPEMYSPLARTPPMKTKMTPELTANGIASLPSCIMQHMLAFLSMREKRALCCTSKFFMTELDKPNSYTRLNVKLDDNDWRPSTDDWLSMIDKGLFSCVKKLRVFKSNDHICNRAQTNSAIALLSALSLVLKNLEIYTVELGKNFLRGNDMTVTLCNRILVNNSKTLTMILWGSDVYSEPWPFPLTLKQFPALEHLNFAGDYDEGKSMIKKAPMLNYLKLTCSVDDTNLALQDAKKLPLKELRLRPVRYRQKIKDVIYAREAMTEGMQNFELDLSKCAGTCEDQLLHLANIPSFNMHKISSMEFTLKVLKTLGRHGKTQGLFLGKNSITGSGLIQFVNQSPEIKYIRLIKEYGPSLTKTQREYFKYKRPGMQFWTRPMNNADAKNKKFDSVVMWKNKSG